jgi:hypothetical protein
LLSLGDRMGKSLAEVKALPFYEHALWSAWYEREGERIKARAEQKPLIPKAR